MRGHDIQQADWFSYKTLEERVPEGPPLTAGPVAHERRAGDHGRGIREAVQPDGKAAHPAGEAASGEPVANILHRAQRAAAHGATGLQPAVPLVCRPEHG